MQEDLPQRSVPRQIHQHVFVDAAIVEEVVRIQLIRPDRFTVSGISRNDGCCPFVVTRPLARIPRRGSRGPVVHEVERRVVGNPTPHGSTADLPAVRRPARDAEILTAVGCVEGMKPRSDQNIAVRTGAPRGPGDLAIRQLQRRELSAHAEGRAAVADQDLAVDDERRHRDRFAVANVAGSRLPDLLAVVRVQGNGLVIERVEDDLPVGIRGAAIDDVAACHALRRRVGVRLVGPFHCRGGLLEAERVQIIRIGRHDVHRAADDERSRFMSLEHAG